MKVQYMAVISILGGAATSLFGGWDYAMQLLVISMIVDYISGVMLAAIWHKSSKSKDGALESGAGFKGLVRKAMILAMVLIAHHMDLAINTNYIRDALVIGFSANEILSILENVGLMGIEYPKVINNAIEILKKKSPEET